MQLFDVAPLTHLPSLQDRFVVPPFTVLDTKQSYWQERRNEWLRWGIRSELGRSENLLNFSAATQLQNGNTGAMRDSTSIFDPVLCEIAYRWFSPPAGRVLDPFAGGSVRGLVAHRLGRTYTGVDLSAEQVAANHANAADVGCDPPPRWIVGDSRRVAELAGPGPYDVLLTCPPYAYLEQYSSDPADLSTLDYPEFLAEYRAILAAACSLLAADAFAVLVVSEVRARKTGDYLGFVPDTIAAMRAAGLVFHNEAILVNSAGSLPIRAARNFPPTRRLGRMHQNVLVFAKGSPRAAADACGPVTVDALGWAAELEPEPPALGWAAAASLELAAPLPSPLAPEPDDDDAPAWRTPLPRMYAEQELADPDPAWDADADDELRLF
jgi:hypothetical protein